MRALHDASSATATRTESAASLRVRGALQLLSLQVITVNRRPAAPCPRLALRPRRRAPRRKTGALPRRTRRARRVRGAVPTLSARPLCAQARHHARRGQRHDLGALSGPDSASRAARRPPQRTARPAQADRLHRRQESPAKPAQPRSRQGRTLTAGQVSQAAKNGDSAWPGGSAPPGRLAAWPRQGRASSPHRGRSLIRMEVRDLTPLPLRYFAAVPSP
jgi:hypothetical protein